MAADLDRATFLAAPHKTPFAGILEQSQVSGTNAMSDMAPLLMAAVDLASRINVAYYVTGGALGDIRLIRRMLYGAAV